MRVNINNKRIFSSIFKDMFPRHDLSNFNGITIDSRKVVPGDIFVPLKGEKDDGHRYIKQAFSSGASLVFVDKKKYSNISSIYVPSTKKLLQEFAKKFRDKLPYPFIGITGSNGKTTTKELLAHILSEKMSVMKTKGNYNSTTGAPLSILSFNSKADIAIIEMGANNPNEIKLICDIIKPNMGIITNIGSAHIKYFSSKEEIAKTKSALFSSLPKNGLAFVNLDDDFIPKMNFKCRAIDYSLNKSADYSGLWKNKSKHLIIDKLSIKLNKYPASMNINGLAAYTIASELGIAPREIISKIKTFKMPAGRCEFIKTKKYIIIDDTYNSNLESIKLGIKTLKDFPSSARKIVIIGDMLELGENEKKYHKNISTLLEGKCLDAVFAFGELTKFSIENIKTEHIYKKFYTNKKILINELKKFLHEGDIIYIKGSRSMKMEKIIKGLLE